MALDLSGMPLDNILLSKVDAPIGDIRQSLLSEELFDAQTLGVWKLMNGQSCTGTEYEVLTGNSNVPDALTEGTFLRQAKSGRALGSEELDAMQGHKHSFSGAIATHNDSAPPGNYITAHSLTDYGSSFDVQYVHNPISDGVNGTPRIANETRPKNIAINFFIKVSHG